MKRWKWDKYQYGIMGYWALIHRIYIPYHTLHVLTQDPEKGSKRWSKMGYPFWVCTHEMGPQNDHFWAPLFRGRSGLVGPWQMVSITQGIMGYGALIHDAYHHDVNTHSYPEKGRKMGLKRSQKWCFQGSNPWIQDLTWSRSRDHEIEIMRSRSRSWRSIQGGTQNDRFRTSFDTPFEGSVNTVAKWLDPWY